MNILLKFIIEVFQKKKTISLIIFKLSSNTISKYIKRIKEATINNEMFIFCISCIFYWREQTEINCNFIRYHLKLKLVIYEIIITIYQFQLIIYSKIISKHISLFNFFWIFVKLFSAKQKKIIISEKISIRGVSTEKNHNRIKMLYKT